MPASSNTHAPMTLVEQVTALKEALVRTNAALDLFADWVGHQLNQSDKELIYDNRQLVARIQAQHEAESAPVSPRVQIIRAAKRLIEALNLPEGGGVAWWPAECWFWYGAKPEPRFPTKDDDISFEPYWFQGPIEGERLPAASLPDWPFDWSDSWITRETPETEEV